MTCHPHPAYLGPEPRPLGLRPVQGLVPPSRGPVVRAFAPASVGNVIAGFDVLGASLRPLEGPPLGDLVEVSEGPGPRLLLEGPGAPQLSGNLEDNLVLHAARAFARAWGRELPALRFRLWKGLPVGSGLGGSAASVAATLVALNGLLGRPLAMAQLLQAAGEAEAQASGAPHLDNVAPALFGGLRLVDPDGCARRLPFPGQWRFVMASPELSLSTKAARAALPAAMPLGLAVEHARNLAALIDRLHRKRDVRGLMRDLLAEPHRAALVPGFRAVQSAALEAGAIGCSLSGAGPACFALSEPGEAAAVGAAMARAWAAEGVPCVVRVCELDPQGARVAA
ncbi:MAG TPA: homoserine kinase [Holophagaceae bacterium]|nr:homoserine kinase [Holophagaceae bacterium]